jgi:hypothetical protein
MAAEIITSETQERKLQGTHIIENAFHDIIDEEMAGGEIDRGDETCE